MVWATLVVDAHQVVPGPGDRGGSDRLGVRTRGGICAPLGEGEGAARQAEVERADDRPVDRGVGLVPGGRVGLTHAWTVYEPLVSTAVVGMSTNPVELPLSATANGPHPTAAHEAPACSTPGLLLPDASSAAVPLPVSKRQNPPGVGAGAATPAPL